MKKTKKRLVTNHQHKPIENAVKEFVEPTSISYFVSYSVSEHSSGKDISMHNKVLILKEALKHKAHIVALENHLKGSHQLAQHIKIVNFKEL